MRAPFGNAVAEVADESVDKFTAAGWSAEGTKKQTAEKPAGDGKTGRAKSSE